MCLSTTGALWTRNVFAGNKQQTHRMTMRPTHRVQAAWGQHTGVWSPQAWLGWEGASGGWKSGGCRGWSPDPPESRSGPQSKRQQLLSNLRAARVEPGVSTLAFPQPTLDCWDLPLSKSRSQKSRIPVSSSDRSWKRRMEKRRWSVNKGEANRGQTGQSLLCTSVSAPVFWLGCQRPLNGWKYCVPNAGATQISALSDVPSWPDVYSNIFPPETWNVNNHPWYSWNKVGREKIINLRFSHLVPDFVVHHETDVCHHDGRFPPPHLPVTLCQDLGWKEFFSLWGNPSPSSCLCCGLRQVLC